MIQRKEYVGQGARSIDTTQEEVCARMDAKIPLAGLASGGTRHRGAECHCGAMLVLRVAVGNVPKGVGLAPRLYDKDTSPR
jgi:hypothetical protein